MLLPCSSASTATAQRFFTIPFFPYPRTHPRGHRATQALGRHLCRAVLEACQKCCPPCRRRRCVSTLHPTAFFLHRPTVHDPIEFAFEIGSGLLTEVRRLQSLLGERDKAIQDMKEEKDDLEKTVEDLRDALKQQEQSAGELFFFVRCIVSAEP